MCGNLKHIYIVVFFWVALVKGNRLNVAEVSGSSDPVPVTFRYVIKPKESMVTHVFAPSGGRPSSTTLRAQALGSVCHGL